MSEGVRAQGSVRRGVALFGMHVRTLLGCCCECLTGQTDANYKNKVQQAHLYASILDKPVVYNYYIENRLLVRRTRIEPANDFLQRSAEDLVMHHGLPGLRGKVDRANLVAEWAVRPHRRARDGMPPHGEAAAGV